MLLDIVIVASGWNSVNLNGLLRLLLTSWVRCAGDVPVKQFHFWFLQQGITLGRLTHWNEIKGIFHLRSPDLRCRTGYRLGDHVAIDTWFYRNHLGLRAGADR